MSVKSGEICKSVLHPTPPHNTLPHSCRIPPSPKRVTSICEVFFAFIPSVQTAQLLNSVPPYQDGMSFLLPRTIGLPEAAEADILVYSR